MKTAINFLALIITCLLVLGSCTSVQKLVEEGNYEEGIRLAQKRLSGKQKKNPKYVAALETAVNKSIDRDLAEAERLERSGTVNWARVHAIYERIDRRQRVLQPLLPLTDKNGYEARFNFADVTEVLAETEDFAAEQFYNQGLDALQRGRNGDKPAAREAYDDFASVQRYRDDYRDVPALMDEARALGTVNIFVAVGNESRAYLPAGLEEELLRLDNRALDTEWRQFDFVANPAITYDYDAQLIVDGIDVSPERFTERIYWDENTITDGVENVLDSDGNVLRDTLGNAITQERRVLVRAQVTEVLQTKSATIRGRLDIYDNYRDQLVTSETLTADADFQNYASTFRGNRRALSRNSLRWIGNRPVSFPTDERLILDAAEALKPALQEQLLRRTYRLMDRPAVIAR